jgi:O-antigen/teichoic acid export membrane protein
MRKGRGELFPGHGDPVVPQPSGNGNLRIVAKNTAYNFFTQILVIAVSFLSFPVLVRKLSSDGFGLLSLIWIVVGYFSLLDLGVSRAITKYVAESLASGDPARARGITWTSLSLSALLGTCVGVAIVAARGPIVTGAFHIPAPMVGEANASLLAAAVGVPFMLANGMLRGIQSAYQRFDMVNAFQAVMGLGQWLGSVALVLMGGGVFEVVLLTVIIRIVAAAAGVWTLRVLDPGVFSGIRLWEGALARQLLSFGGWVSVSQVVSPLFLYVDRFMIGSFLSLTAVAYYTVPQETVMRMLILPMSLSNALYPVFSGGAVRPGGQMSTGLMYTRSIRYVALLTLPLTAVLVIITPELLTVWMGKEFSLGSSMALRILVCGFFFSSVAQIPATVLHAFGRPDLTAKYHVVELPVTVLLNLLLIPLMGIAGAALAWSVRVSLDAFLLVRGVRRHIAPAGGERLAARWTAKGTAALIILALMAGAVLSVESGVFRACGAAVFLPLYALGVWRYAMDDGDREFMIRLRARLIR